MSGKERRQNPRKPMQLAVTMHVGGGGTQLQGVSADLSKTGIFVQVKEQLVIGQRIDLIIDPHEKDGLIVIGGVVKHLVKDVGVGIEFTKPSPQSLDRIEKILANARDA
jgi:hypothetical protein